MKLVNWFDADGAAGVQLAGRDADFAAHTELAAVGVLGRCIDHDDGAVDPVDEGLGGGGILGDDGIRVLGTMAGDVVDGVLDPIDDADRDDRIKVLRVPILVRRRHDATIDRRCLAVAADLAARIHPGRRRGPAIGPPRTFESTSRVSVVPQIPVRRIFAFTTTLRAISGSAAAST